MCLQCGNQADKVLYAGFPMKLCTNHEEPLLWGFWSWIPVLWFNGVFILYTGSYWGALRKFLKGE